MIKNKEVQIKYNFKNIKIGHEHFKFPIYFCFIKQNKYVWKMFSKIVLKLIIVFKNYSITFCRTKV